MDIDDIELSPDVTMSPNPSVEQVSAGTLMDVELGHSHPTLRSPRATLHLPGSFEAREGSCTRVELGDTSDEEPDMYDKGKGKGKGKAETKTKIRLVENDNTLQLRNRLLFQQHTQSKRNNAYKAQLKQYIARYDQILLYAHKQQETVAAYTEQIFNLQQQIIKSNEEWNEKFKKYEADFAEREQQSVTGAQARLSGIQASLEKKAKEQDTMVELLKNEIQELKAANLEKNDMIANLTTRLAQKKLSGDTHRGSEQTSPVVQREMSPLYSTAIHQAVTGTKRTVVSSTRSGRTMLHTVGEAHSGTANSRVSLPTIPSTPAIPNAPTIPSTPMVQEAAITAETLLNGFKDVVNQLQRFNVTQSQPSSGNTNFGRSRTKAKVKLEREIKSQSKGVRKAYLEICWEIAQKAFNIEQDEDIITHIPPSPAELLSVREGETAVNGSQLLIDMQGKIHSEWNCQVMEILNNKVKKEASVGNLPPCSEEYINQLVQDRVVRLRSIWRDTRPKRDEMGFVESPEELEERLVRTKGETGKSMRHLSRRTAKYERRKHIIANTIVFKQEAGDSDVALWQWLEQVLDKLTVDGMSSDESEDSSSLQVVYRVKILPWRRSIEQELNIIDHERRSEMAGFSTKGSTPIIRIRSEFNPISDRKPVTELPRIFYNDSWYQEAPSNARERTLSVSREQFQWLRLIGGRQ